MTFLEQLNRYKGFGPGFDLVRIVLAVGVLVWHAVAIAENGAAAALSSPAWPFIYAILPMFFALSGFLVTASALRLPLREYVLNRVFRIGPALAVDIFFCALILGPIITSFTLQAYFTDPQFFRYFLNIFGWIHYLLPGVFLSNPYPNIVNGALWTVPYEIGCYIVMSLLIWAGVIRKWQWVLGLALVIMIAGSVLHLSGLKADHPLLQAGMNFAFFNKGASLIPCFLVGSAAYLMRGFLPYDWRIAASLFAGLVLLAFFGPPAWFKSPVFIAASVIPLTYLVVWLGLTPLPKVPGFGNGDYSYGIYLYHFPILQLLQMLFGFSSWWILALGGLIPVVMFAAFSWHRIEKPALLQRKRFSLVGARLAAEDEKKLSSPAG